MPPLHPNNDHLRTTLEALPLLDGRYANMKLVNWNPTMAQKRGVFSLVFRAEDVVDGKPVALKFYDISTLAMADAYRRTSFDRESEILKTLLTHRRCLQLARALNTYSLAIPGSSLTIGCPYFAVEWLPDELDPYFHDVVNGTYSPAKKLELFDNAVLAVRALHARAIFHRDLKVDNLRFCDRDNEQLVVAIDLGTAARFDSGPIASSYGFQVGAPGYAAPEALAGLAGNRQLARYTDVYALGCLLYELFNFGYFYDRMRALNTRLDLDIVAMRTHMTAGLSDTQQKAQWEALLTRFALGVTPVPIDGPGSAIPLGILPQLNSMLAAMTEFDYRRRPLDLEEILAKSQIAIRILRNQEEYKKRVAMVRERRRRREEKAARLDARFRARRALPGASC